MTAPKDEISSVEKCIAWQEGYKRNMTWSGPLREHDDSMVSATISHLRRLQQMEAELETRDAQFKAMLASYSDKCSALALDIANKTAELEACRRGAEASSVLRALLDRNITYLDNTAVLPFENHDQAMNHMGITYFSPSEKK